MALSCFFGFRGIDDVNCFQGLDDVSATSGYNKANQRFRLPALGFLIVFSSNHSDLGAAAIRPYVKIALTTCCTDVHGSFNFIC